MGEKERYIVAKMDGTMLTVVAYTFAEVLEQVKDDDIWQITKLFFDE